MPGHLQEIRCGEIEAHFFNRKQIPGNSEKLLRVSGIIEASGSPIYWWHSSVLWVAFLHVLCVPSRDGMSAVRPGINGKLYRKFQHSNLPLANINES